MPAWRATHRCRQGSFENARRTFNVCVTNHFRKAIQEIRRYVRGIMQLSLLRLKKNCRKVETYQFEELRFSANKTSDTFFFVLNPAKTRYNCGHYRCSSDLHEQSEQKPTVSIQVTTYTCKQESDEAGFPRQVQLQPRTTKHVFDHCF